jgi:hypothetical protein
MALIVYNVTGSPVTLAAGNPVRVIPASSSPPNRGEGFNVTSELQGLSGANYTALEAQRPLTLEYEWTGEAEYSTGTLVVVGLDATWMDKYLRRGVERAGIPDGEVGYFFEEFVDLSNWYKSGGTDIAAVTSTIGGVCRATLAAGGFTDYRNGDAGLGSPTVLKADGSWYIAARMQINPSTDSDVWAGAGTFETDVAENFSIGLHTFGSATKGSLAVHNGSSVECLLSTVTIGTTWHDYEAWSAGGDYYLSVDGETPVSLTPTTGPTGFHHARLRAVCTDVGLTISFDKLLYVFPQAV